MQIGDFRVSFAWTQTVLDPTAAAAADGALAWVANETPYVEYFNRLLFQQAFKDMPGDAEAPTYDLSLPWKHPSGQGFWIRYLQQTPGATSGQQAWAKLVPFRLGRTLLPRLGLAKFSGSIVAEAFIFPHGLGLIVTARSRERLEAADWVTAASGVRTGKLTVNWPQGARDSLTLEALAERLLGTLRTATFGDAVPSQPLDEPLSITTVTQGADGALDQAPADGGDVHRVIHAVSAWPRRWRAVALPALVEGETLLAVSRTNLAPADILYATRRGRCVWFPSAFTDPTPGLHTLACYHRNLVLATLQVESLMGAVKTIAAELRRSGGVDPLVDRLGRMASGLLGRLYGGRDTYRSASVRAHIDHSGLIPDIDLVRQRHNNPPLA